MKRPESIARFLQRNEYALAPERIERIDRYTSELFERALFPQPDGTVFVMTGDIPAMWIRDSTWQILPLLEMDPDQELIEVAVGVNKLQARQLGIDPYANAFNIDANYNCWHQDFADQSPWVFERKFEIDSLAAFFELAVSLFELTSTTSHLTEDFWNTVSSVIQVIATERKHARDSYVFVRQNAPQADYLSHGGHGAPFANTGLVWSGFRPSDDRCLFPFHIPGNAHLAVTLKKLGRIASANNQVTLAQKLGDLSRALTNSLIELLTGLDQIPYEVDGLGNALYQDDPNFPSILSLPFLGWCAPNDPLYLSTRSWLLSTDNPGFRCGPIAEGLSSEHTPPTHVWPLSIAMRGLTATSLAEAMECMEMLERTDAGTGAMHESFDVDDPGKFTRPWFSWADMSYCRLALHVHKATYSL